MGAVERLLLSLFAFDRKAGLQSEAPCFASPGQTNRGYFVEIVETRPTRDHVDDAGVFIRPPPGRGWRVINADRERHTEWHAPPAGGARLEEAAMDDDRRPKLPPRSAVQPATAAAGWRAVAVMRIDRRRCRFAMAMTASCWSAVLPAAIRATSWPSCASAVCCRRVRDAGEPVRRVNPKPAPKPAQPDRGDLVPRLWRESVDPRGTLAEQYLRGRGLDLDDDLCGARAAVSWPLPVRQG